MTYAFDPALERELVQVAERMADAARTTSLAYFRRRDLAAESKVAGGFDPVTVADRETEAAMCRILAELRPDDAVLGEETGRQSGRSGLIWVLDPIDGTRSFISGLPTWGVLIAVGDESGPKLGLIDQPFTGERYLGGFGMAQFSRGDTVETFRTRDCAALSDATMLSTYPEIGTPDEMAAFGVVKDQVQLTRYGTDCYGYALLALGQVDLVIEAGLQSYDIQAPIAVVEAAGGIVTDWSGGPAHHGGQVIAAGDRRVHDAALELLARN